jgi:hypothetical protein
MAQHLKHHVVADRQNEATEPLGILDRLTGLQILENTRECLLPDFVDQMPRANAVPQFKPDDVAKVRCEVTLGFEITTPQTPKVSRIELGAYQWSSSNS